MRIAVLLLGLLISSTGIFAQQPAHPNTSNRPLASDSSILLNESANLKSDLAQLRAMLNVLASQESGTDARSFAALQTNRQMWQVIIARLAEITKRMDAIEQRQRSTTTGSTQPPLH